MLSKIQFEIINACADDYEVFYFLFAEVNFGGQVFPRSSGPSGEQNRDEGSWTITVKSDEIIAGIIDLVLAGLLSCRRFIAAGTYTELTTKGELDAELSIYRSYQCITYEDHFERFGYGPHEFYPTETGIKEIGDSKYDAYLK